MVVKGTALVTLDDIEHTIRVGIRSTDPDTRMGAMPAFGRDGIPFDEKALAGLRELGIEVSERESSGWGTFVSHPEHSRLPNRIAEELDSWLELDPPAAGADPRLQDRLQMRLQDGNGSHFVLAHQAAVAGHVGGQDRR